MLSAIGAISACYLLIVIGNVYLWILQFIIAGAFGVAAAKKNRCLVRYRLFSGMSIILDLVSCHN